MTRMIFFQVLWGDDRDDEDDVECVEGDGDGRLVTRGSAVRAAWVERGGAAWEQR